MAVGLSSMKERAVSRVRLGPSGGGAPGVVVTAGAWAVASESSIRSRWAGRLCRATLEGSIKWAAVGLPGWASGGH